MNRSEFDAFRQALAELFASKGRRAGGDTWDASVTAYWRALEAVPFGAVLRAIAEARDSGDPLPIAGKLRESCKRFQTEASSTGCHECASRPGFIHATWWSPVYNAPVTGWMFCDCPLGERKSQAAREVPGTTDAVPTRRMLERASTRVGREEPEP